MDIIGNLWDTSLVIKISLYIFFALSFTISLLQ